MTQQEKTTAIADAEIDLGALATLFWAQKLRIAACALIGGLLALAFVLSTPRIYQADALLQLEETSSGLEGVGSLFSDEPKSLAEVEIFRSRRVLGSVVDELDLTLIAAPLRLPVLFELPERIALPPPGWPVLAGYDWADAAIVAGQFDIPDALRGESFGVARTGARTYRLRTPGGAVADGTIGVVLEMAEPRVRLRIDSLEGPAGRQFRLERITRLEAIRRLREALTISEVGRGTEILRVTFSGEDPATALRVLDALTHAYFAQNLSRNTAEVEQSLAFVDAQLPEARARLDAAQEELNAYRESQKSVDLGLETTELLTRATELRQKLSELDLREQDIRQRFRENHPVYQRLLAARSELERQLRAVLNETEALPDTQKVIFNLTQDLDVAREVYFQLVNSAQQLQLARASSIGNVRILDRAAVMPDPVAPATGLLLGLGIAFGAAGGLGLALLRHFFRRKVGDIEDVEDLGLAVYGVVNRVAGAGARRPRRGARMKLMAEIDGATRQMEALRSLRTSLHFGLIDKSPQAIMVTSAAPGDGKSFISANLAAVAALPDARVCLVDADLRRGYLDRYFRVPRSPGLSEYLAGNASLDEVLTPVGDDGLFFLPSGKYPPNPSELFMGPRFAALVAELGRRFALTVYDAPPILAVTDPAIIARHVPVSLAVVRHRVTDLGAARAMHRAFERAGQRIDGAILNDFRPERARDRGGAYHYAYDYAPRAE